MRIPKRIAALVAIAFATAGLAFTAATLTGQAQGADSVVLAGNVLSCP
ncbi:hypothetical protein [Streptomyces sp. NPDC004284]